MPSSVPTRAVTPTGANASLSSGDWRGGGVVIYGDEPGENLGVWDRYGYRGKILGLLRGACLHWAHPHSASKLIRRSMDLLPERYRVITATVDRAAGEIGTVYQAAGF